jgi:hypothetical protein
MGISTISHIKRHTSTYLGNIILPGQTFNGAIIVVNKTPVKTAKKVILKYISKKLGADDIFTNHDYKFKQKELRIVYKSSIINIK